MGITGTEVAKEASDIVILDDNFNSIVASVSWGRCVFSNIRKFLQFQLTINGVALVVATLSAVTQRGMPLNVMQLLWVNLIMDSLAALALATERPNVELLQEKPHGRDASLISRNMWKHIMVQATFQVAVLMAVLWVAPELDRYSLPKSPDRDDFNCLGLRGGDFLAADETRPMCCVGANINATAYTLPEVPGVQEEVTFGECCYDCGDDCDAERERFLPGSDGEAEVEDFPLPWMGKVEHPTRVCSLLVPELNDALEIVDDVEGVCCCDPKWSDKRCVPYHDAEHEYEHANLAINSLVFNVFIAMELFNFINARKINDELNIFKGIFTSPVFSGVLFVILVSQVIIMESPLNSFFKVQGQTWEEWLLAIGIGFLGWPLALVTKLLTPSRGKIGSS
jgi:Ca2+-transporting ATPase